MTFFLDFAFELPVAAPVPAGSASPAAAAIAAMEAVFPFLTVAAELPDSSQSWPFVEYGNA